MKYFSKRIQIAFFLLICLLIAPTFSVVSAAGNVLKVTGKIAFSSDRGGNFEIYVMNPDGSGQTRLTNNIYGDEQSSWSPNGTKIAFSSNRDGNWEIYVMNHDGSEQKRLTYNNHGMPQPSWSPDGTKIAFTSDRDGNVEIYVMNADGSGQTRITNNNAADEQPRWSPDGTKIAFNTDRDGNMEIYVTNADGSGQTRITDNNDGDEDPDWSPDGAKFVFVSNRDGSHQIYSMNADGSGQTRLTNNNAEEWNCRWSPDGTKISFDTNRDGNFEIYVMNPDGSGQTRLTNNSAVDWDSSWQSLYMTHFRQIGIGSDFTGNVLNVDNSSYTINQLPTSIPWSPGTSHNFSWSSPLTVSNDKRYVWSSTSGLSTEKSGTFIATSGNDSITANYITQYYVRFQALTGGSIAQSSNWYNASSTVAISALPSIGYKFSYWTAAGNVLVADAASQNTTVTVNGAGNVTASFVDATPPSITNVTQFPVKTNVSPQDPVKINATVTDDLSGVQQVTLNYTTGNGTWTAITMSNLGGSTWNASIPTLSYGTNVTYIIMARDNAENNVTTQALGLTYNYQVVPEFPMLPIVFIIFTISTLLIVVLNKRKHRH